jgi:small redox-active disulfide protein 2
MKHIQILGPGCTKCTKLAEAAEIAAKASGQPYAVTKVTDIVQIMSYGVLSTPALVIDGQVKSVGKLLSPADITLLLA